AAETGHLVFGTLHTTSAPKTIDRIVDVLPGDEKPMIRSMLSESLRAVISQTLLKKVGGGRVAAHEIMIATSAIKNL
ncbi:ATPase, T2SS/T4P/T4SS family, partial [Pseudoalteromonas sp. SIMBA_148]